MMNAEVNDPITAALPVDTQVTAAPSRQVLQMEDLPEFHLIISTASAKIPANAVNVDTVAGDLRGLARGKALAAHINGKAGGEIVLVVHEVEPWVSALANNAPLYAGSTWRRVCDRVLGPHYTQLKATKVTVITDGGKSVEVTNDSLLSNWVAARPKCVVAAVTDPNKESAKKPEKKDKAEVKKTPQKSGKVKKNSVDAGATKHNERRDLRQGSRAVGGRLAADLLLLAKGHYGRFDPTIPEQSTSPLVKAAIKVVSYHGVRHFNHMGQGLGGQLFNTIVEFAPTGTIHKFSFIRGLAQAGSDSPQAMATFLLGELELVKVDDLPPVDSRLERQLADITAHATA